MEVAWLSWMPTGQWFQRLEVQIQKPTITIYFSFVLGNSFYISFEHHIMVKIDHFVSICVILIALTKQFRQAWYDQEESYHVRSNL
jgi:hypothetical protein